MGYLKKYGEWTKEDILKELCLNLLDAGLDVKINLSADINSQEYHIDICDKDKIFCKNYPKDELDWLLDKPIMKEFYQDLEDFDLKWDEDYKIYAGGLGVRIVFNKFGLKKLHL